MKIPLLVFSYLFCLLLLVACSAEMETVTVAPTATVAVSTATDTPVMVAETATYTPAPLTSTPTASPIAPSATQTPVPLPPPPGEIYFFWDSTPFNTAGVPSTAPKHNLYIATAGNVFTEWHIDTLLDKVLNWTTEAPSFPQVALSPDQTKLALTTWLDAGGDGNVHTEESGGVGDLTAVQVYDLTNETLTLLTDYSALEARGLAWFPNNQSLAFSWGKEVYLQQLDDKTSQQITSSFPQNVGQILSSPDGNFMAIWVQPGQLYLLNMSNNELTLLTPLEQSTPFVNMAWSSDSQWLAFITGADPNLMLANSDTLEVVPLLETGLSMSTWSPVTSQIALIQTSPGLSSLHVLDVGPLTDRKLIEWEGNGASVPIWSPDGQQISLSFTGPDFATIYVIDVNTGEITELFSLEDFEKAELRSFNVHSWSPDGEWLLYSDARRENTGLYVINATRGDSSLLLEIPENTVPPDHFFWLSDSQ